MFGLSEMTLCRLAGGQQVLFACKHVFPTNFICGRIVCGRTTNIALFEFVVRRPVVSERPQRSLWTKTDRDCYLDTSYFRGTSMISSQG